MKLKISAIIAYSAFLLFFGAGVFAQTTTTEKSDVGSDLPKFSNPFSNPNLSVSIPGFKGFRNIECITDEDGKSQGCVVPWLADYINGLYSYGIGAVIILAVIVMMIGGVVWLTAGGNDKRIADAKQWIGGSLLGIVVATSSYVILNIINPALTELSPLKISTVQKRDLDDITLAEVSQNDVVTGTIQAKGQECFYDTFGKTQSEVESNFVRITLFGKNVPVHKLAKDAFEKVNRELEGKLGNYKFYYIDTYAWRANVNNPSERSTHSFGITVDLNPDDNPNYKSKAKPCKSDLPSVLVNAFKNNGFRWGGDYRTRCDAMHFEWLGPCQK